MVNAIIVVATVITILGMIEVWANRLVLNPNNWAETSAQLLQNDTIRAAAAGYLVDQLYSNVNVQGVVQSALPQPFKRLSGPVSGALRGAAGQVVNLALTRPKLVALWREANRAADQTLVGVIEGHKGVVDATHGVVKLDLATLLNQIAARLGLPKNVASKLPPSVAQLVVVRSKQLDVVQSVGRAFQGLAILFSVLAVALYALAVILARGFRRRALMHTGASIVFAGVLVFLVRTLLVNHLANAVVADASLRPAVTATLGVVTQLLSEMAGAAVLIGLVLMLAAWVAGPGREAVAIRRFIAPTFREHPVRAYAVVIAILALIFIWQPIPATGNWYGILIFTVLALVGTEVLRRQMATEFAPGSTRGGPALIGRLHRHDTAARPGDQAPQQQNGGSLTEQLERLAALRSSGAITDEEYGTAKGALLGSSPPSADTSAQPPADAPVDTTPAPTDAT
jgi:hypothetical protein